METFLNYERGVQTRVRVRIHYIATATRHSERRVVNTSPSAVLLKEKKSLQYLIKRNLRLGSVPFGKMDGRTSVRWLCSGRGWPSVEWRYDTATKKTVRLRLESSFIGI